MLSKYIEAEIKIFINLFFLKKDLSDLKWFKKIKLMFTQKSLVK